MYTLIVATPTGECTEHQTQDLAVIKRLIRQTVASARLNGETFTKQMPHCVSQIQPPAAGQQMPIGAIKHAGQTILNLTLTTS